MIPQAIRRRPGLTWVVVLSVIEMVALVIGIGSPGQSLLTGLFVLTCPGFLLLDLPNPRSLAARVLLGAGASLALNASLIAIDRAGYTLPVAAVLILSLAVVAFLPRAALRRGINSIKSMVSRTEAGHTNPSAAADRLTPLYVDRQATALVEPNPSADGDLAPTTDDVALTEPLAADTMEAAQEEDEAPAQEEDVPDQEDEAPAQEEDEAPAQEEDETPAQEEDETPAQEEQEEDDPLDQEEDETPVQEEDEVPEQKEDQAPAEEEDETPAQEETPAEEEDDDIPTVATAEDVTALLEELRAADDPYEVTPDQADVAASAREAKDTPYVPGEADIPPVSVPVNTAESVDDEVDAPKQDSKSESKDKATPSSPDEGRHTLEDGTAATDEYLEVSEDDTPLVEAGTTAPPDEVGVASGEEDATQSEAASVTAPDDVDIQPPPIVIFGVDINRAGPEAIAAFPGMEPEPAALIVAYRDRHGPFGNAKDLVRLLRAIEARQNARNQASGSR